jgi:hypothetical protein
MPALSITEDGGRVSLRLGRLARGEGASLQEAADELIGRLLELAMAVRSGAYCVSRELRPEFETLSFLHEVAEIAGAGGDVRARVFG